MHFFHTMTAKYASGSAPGDGKYAMTTDESGQFWGSAGAGGVFLAEDTGRILLAFRSALVNEPHTWGVWGGAIDPQESPQAAVLREVKEETGYHGKLELKPIYTYKKYNFRYYNFLIKVPEEFKPKLCWETENYGWFDIDQLPSPLHFGLKALLPHLKTHIKTKIQASTKKLYHVTKKKNLENILKVGLEPRVGEITRAGHGSKAQPLVYLLDKPAPGLKNKDSVVLEINPEENNIFFYDGYGLRELDGPYHEHVDIPVGVEEGDWFTEEVIEPKNIKVVGSYSDWSGEWVHYSDINKLGINPQQFHLDVAGIYLFPKEFKAAGTLWKQKKYKFTVKLSENSKVLDLSKISKNKMREILDKLEIKFSESLELNADSFWEALKNHYSLRAGAGKNIGKWNADFRRLGYDAIFDDTGSIHTAEVQVVVLNPKIIKILDVETQNIKRGQFDRLKKALDYLTALLKPFGKVEVDLKKKKELYSRNANNVGKLELSLDNNRKIYWKVSEDEANHRLWVTMDYASNIPSLEDNWGTKRESVTVENEDFSEIKKLVERVMSKVSVQAFYKKLVAKYIIVTADFKTIEKKFLDQGEEKTEVNKYLEIFKKLREKNKLKAEEKDIDSWGKKSFKEFKEKLTELEKEKTNTEKRKGAVNTAKEVSGAKKIKEDDNWVIYEILTNAAAAELGQGTEWCIKHNPSKLWKEYSTDNNIYYIISKTLPAKDPWAKIAFLIDKEGETSYWDALNEDHLLVPKELKIPNFKYEKPSIWKYSGGDLDVSFSGLDSLEGAPEKVGGNFSCHENKLKSLDGAPKEVGGSFNCAYQKNGKKFTEEEVRAVCNVKGKVYV